MTHHRYTKLLMQLCLLPAVALWMAACGGDDEPGGTDAAGPTNANRNSTATYREAGRLEFPHLAAGNSLVLVHKVSDGSDAEGVNYAVEWDIDKKSQRWTCYQMTRRNSESHTSRYYGDPQYPRDPDLPSAYAWSVDYIYGSSYNGNSFDHGHICPSADRLYSAEANYQTFFLTNMQPQFKRFNGSDRNYSGMSLWLKMEETLRSWVPSSDGDTLFVCKGGTIDSVYIDNERQSGVLTRIQQRLIVPKYFFAALLLKKQSQQPRAMAFWFEHTNDEVSATARISDYIISIDELEQRTGIDFFCNLPDDVETVVERSFSLSAWGLR